MSSPIKIKEMRMKSDKKNWLSARIEPTHLAHLPQRSNEWTKQDSLNVIQ